MADMKMLSDEQLVAAITLCYNNMTDAIKKKNLEDSREWEEVWMTFLREQKSREEQYSKDELERAKFELENEKLVFQKHESEKKLKFEYEQKEDANSRFMREHALETLKHKLECNKLWLDIAKVGAALFTGGASIYSAWAGLQAKKIEMETKERCWDNICDLDRDGEITLNQANKTIKL